MIRTRLYRDGAVVAADFDPADISEHMSADDGVIWLDLSGPDVARLDLLSAEFGLNAFAVADATGRRQRPKLDRYTDHGFLTVYTVDFAHEAGTLSVCELAVFVAPHYLITVQKDPGFPMAEVVHRWDANDDLAAHGVAFLLHGLLDVVVDSHFATVEQIDGEFEELEDLLFDSLPGGPLVQRRTFELRKSLVVLRRLVLPMREVLNALLRREMHVIDEDMVPAYQDVYDHVLRVSEWTESLRDLVSTILDTNVALQGNRLNVITKRVTSYAAIIAVPTLVTGYYGMNVRIWPAAGTLAGGLVALGLVVVLSVALWFVFRAADWL